MIASVSLSNEDVAEVLDQVAELLEAQEANPFRVGAYRRAAERLRSLDSRAADVLDAGGVDALTAIPNVGESIGRCIAEILETGGLMYLDRLRGRASPEVLFATVPGVGPKLAKRIHDRLGIESLEELEAAAHDGRLASVPGFGRRRMRAVSEALAGRLGVRSRRRARREAADREPADVAEVLDVDREYREKAEAGKLRRITPRRFNPDSRAWLPILHTSRGGRNYTALFSNTAVAHELGKTDDWVVIYTDDGARERQATVVTETRGPLQGRRVVRGREEETRAFYERSEEGAPSTGYTPRATEERG